MYVNVTCNFVGNLNSWFDHYPPVVGWEAYNRDGNCWQKGGKDLIQDPSTEYNVNLDSVVTISYFSKQLVIVSDVIELDEILG